MKQHVARGIVLSRTNYGEADRIITVLTQNRGKLRLLAKGVRRIKSKMAGGIELFSVNDITYIEGKSGMGTLISSRLYKNYGNIVKDVGRTMYAYEVLKLFNKVTEDDTEEDYFVILSVLLLAINDLALHLDLIRLWGCMQLLRMTGQSPNLSTDMNGEKLSVGVSYTFSFDDMTFAQHVAGPFQSDHIKLLRLAAGSPNPQKLSLVSGVQQLLPELAKITQVLLKQNIRS